jgi:hypothetical protein
MKYLVIYWIWIYYTISIMIEKFDSYDFTKNIWTSFPFKWTYVCWKKTFCWKFTFIWKMTRIVLEALCIKNPFYMFIKTLNEIKEKLSPKYTKAYPKNSTFFGLKCPPLSVFSPFMPYFISFKYVYQCYPCAPLTYGFCI